MKNFSILILIILILFSSNNKISAQEDSVIIENTTEPAKDSDYKQKKKYKYLDHNYKEEKTLIKIGLVPVKFEYARYDRLDHLWENFNLTLSFEKKICPSFSFQLDNGIRNVTHNAIYDEKRYFFSDFGIRYYYSMNKKLKEGRGKNNFHGNYFSIKLDEWAKYGLTTKTYNSGGLYPEYVILNDWTFRPYVNFSWGMQRRIGKIGFVDVGTYFKFKKDYYEYGVNLLIGFGWGFKTKPNSNKNKELSDQTNSR